MPKIRVLPDTLASQVAAGEVVERPASVVKELVENSLDAGAREIWVDIDKGGVAMIRVRDDGSGMSREDAMLSLERHATSKLHDAAGLATICTLGFRGEAVPSIASVSRFRLITCEAGAVAGTEITVNGGKMLDVKDAGSAVGTTIEAKSLFFNVPARRKFLRAESTESAHVEHQVRLHALAAPGVRFRFRRDGREVFDLPAVDKPVDRIRQLLDSDLAGELVGLPPIESDGISVMGFVLPAKHARKGRRHQFVMLNGRPVEDAVISRALGEGFRGAVADGLHPAAWLWIGMDPQRVDVNVHPAKREVRFHRPVEIKNAIVDAVTGGLRALENSRQQVVATSVAPTPNSGLLAPRPQPVSLPPSQAMLDDWPTPAKPVGETDHTAASAVPDFRLLGVLHDRYVVMESEDGLVLLDPRAARERILYEALKEGSGAAGESQGLLVPLLLELDPRDVDVLLREQAALADAGMDIESFGGNTVQISRLPACLHLPDARTLVGHLLDELLHDAVSGATRFARERMARICARQAAMGTGARLAEVPSLLRDLFACDLPYCTADGRPTLTEFGVRDLERRFGVKGS